MTSSSIVEDCADRSQATIDDLQSTLLVYLAAPWDQNRLLVASAQIGDGALFVLQQKKEDRELPYRWTWLQQPQIQGAGNEVQPFIRASSDDWTKSFRWKLIDDAICVMGMTDGTADDIEPPQPTPENPNPDPFLFVNDFYQRIIVPAFTHAQPAEALMKALGYRKKLSYDDRTVVCLYRY